jgi:hypothetical protein
MIKNIKSIWQMLVMAALAVIFLVSCNGGSSTTTKRTPNSVDSNTTGYTLNKYISQLQQAPLKKQAAITSIYYFI